MEILINLISLIASLSLLVFLGERLIDASLRLARAFGVSSAAIGLTVLAYGTSLPEFAVSSIASVKQHSDLSISNVIGSNIYNIAIVLGIASIISPISIKEKIFARRDGVVMLLATFLLTFLAYLGRIEGLIGIIMSGLIAFYIYYILRHDRVYSGIESDKGISKIRETVIVIILLAGVLISGNFTVDSAVNLARTAGVSEWVIGATIVAAGTSLPETVVSIIAAKRGEFGISVGNIAGSNIFNILWILGFASILNPLSINFSKVYLDIIFLNLITILFYAGLLKGRLTKAEGILYIAIYLSYIYYLL